MRLWRKVTCQNLTTAAVSKFILSENDDDDLLILDKRLSDEDDLVETTHCWRKDLAESSVGAVVLTNWFGRRNVIWIGFFVPDFDVLNVLFAKVTAWYCIRYVSNFKGNRNW